ncbi:MULTISPECIES: phage repressor protein CI [Enterobacter cloacae complex]|uniref:Phage repressor protein CI n=2 Tax=Enterobacter cloacae complex TaxID=354276 RepID=A0ABU6KQZ3_ENTAS|nr:MULTISPECIES: phage repressor protein CI [Enterobacter cloacae complex]MBS7115618.1 phage repressor protein CI [Enterobacter cloacae]KJP18947.1 phage repressor protein [Enterobacter asburiae]KLP94966.1 phage repressor protein [Enterobacter asburiae]KOQ94200.1 phage repressor protein [Enterobacter asburiae]KVJ83970.1 phage repressor protein [Enterobacter asburiae]
MDFSSGGKKVIERLVEAYGFSTRQALCDHLGVSKSTMATRYMRDIFPADWVLQCAIETGHPLEWLSFGKGEKKVSHTNAQILVPAKKLISGALIEDGSYVFDKTFLSEKIHSPFIIREQDNEYICSLKYDDISDGLWVIGIDEKISIRTLTRLPNNRLYVEGGNRGFECSRDEIQIVGIVWYCILKRAEKF